MAMTPALLTQRVRKHRDLANCYRRSFGKLAIDDEAVMVNLAKALAAFQETIVTGRTPFDEFRDALARGDQAAQALYPEAAQRGLKLFVGRGNCGFCHFGPHFTNGEFADVGIPYVAAPGQVDSGSHATLADVVRHCSDLNEDRLHAAGERILKPLRLTESESADLVAFLESLSESHTGMPTGRQPRIRDCRIR